MLELAAIHNVDVDVCLGRQVSQCDTEYASWKRFEQSGNLSPFNSSVVGLFGLFPLLDDTSEFLFAVCDGVRADSNAVIEGKCVAGLGDGVLAGVVERLAEDCCVTQ